MKSLTNCKIIKTTRTKQPCCVKFPYQSLPKHYEAIATPTWYGTSLNVLCENKCWWVQKPKEPKGGGGGGLEGSEVVIGGIAWEGQSGGSYPFALVGPTLTYKEAFFFKL